MIGTYVFNEDKRDTLIISANNSYMHISYRDNKKLIDTGKWKFNGVEIAFDNFAFANSGVGLWSTRVFQNKNRICLNYAEEDVFYFKIN